jgi:hypothetical protein
MERELWPLLYHRLRALAKNFHQKYVHIPGWILVAVLLWAALHDRPISWACQPRHWSTTTLKPLRLPSPATMSRRLDRVGVGLLLRAFEQCLRDSGDPRLVAFIDGKPLLVGGCSKDKDSHFGRAAGHIGRGYKLHALWACRCVPETWEVRSLNISEKEVLRGLLGQLHYGGYLLGDGNYDASDLFDQAAKQGYQLIVPLPAGANPGSGKHYQSPYRLRSIALMQKEFGQQVYQSRTAIERSFGNASSFGGGLQMSLPAWVRGLPRVRSWVWAKLLINGVRIMRNNNLQQD